MDEQRMGAYLALIQELLNCPSGEENDVLNRHQELLDEGFVQVCEQRAAQLQGEGRENAAGFLRNVAQAVGAFLAREGTGGNQQGVLQQFWRQLLQAERQSGGDEAAVHQVMRQNMGLIVPTLGDTIAQFVQGYLAENPDEAEGIANLVENTCISIGQFPYGRYAEALEIAIRGYGVVLELRADNPPKRAQTLNVLGLARSTQAEMGINPAPNLDGAIAAYDQAAEIRRRLKLEKDLSTTLTNLGSAHLTQAQRGINPAANLDRAIAAYDEAAQIWRRLKLEKDLSMTLNNLGLARQTQAEMDINPATNLEGAVAAYDEAAEILRRLGLTRNLATTLNNFGFAYRAQSRLAGNSSTQTQQALENAYQSFQAALDQVEYLRGEIGADSEGYKRNFNEEWNKVYLGMVEVCLELGRYQDAIEYADRSKARNLVELMATRDAYPGGVIPENIRQRLDELKIAIAQAERRLQQGENLDPEHLNQLRQEKQQLEPYKPLHFDTMQALLDEETAILEWYILGDKFLTFILMPDPPLTPPSEAGGITLWTSSKEDRDQLIDWTNAYLKDYYTNKDQWRETLAQRLEELPKILHLDEILANLFKTFPTCQKLILIPHLYLHLFPLHALPITIEEGANMEGGCNSPLQDDPVGAQRLRPIPLQDLFPNGIAYAPNCQVLQQAQNRINQRPHFNQLFAIQNPTQDLQFTDIEVEAIQTLFDPHHTLKHDQAEKTAIDPQTLKNAHCTHFSCHGYFNFENPLKSALILAQSEFTPPPTPDDTTRYLPLKKGKFLDLQKCLTLEDILRLDLGNCRLVTLSACETGITDISSTSDEYIGLPSGFILAGSPNVISTLWTVADISTAIFMIHFYQTLKNQPDLAVVLALQQTQKWLREATVTDLLNWTDGCEAISSERQEEIKDVIDGCISIRR
ncbi:CHAT domain-containing protein [Spirulina sp. CCNP1310]|uniref:CHAT domain-containing protein n=1 Tax=Spirulina sp. CCNP1310 TaxID=3110249 RepID=UPI002B1F0D46|nr:CHAT domain-containing protein [Spirulina sp. CCNP1310]MEA5421551.1 CHAT domain-containing protein [Spirulina sp. CCNP1310]